MKTTLRALAILGFTLAFGLPAAQAQSFVQVRDGDVFVDLPSGFSYLKTPTGWKFMRQLDEEQMAHLPAGTLTSLLPREQPEIHFAHPAMELSPRMMALRANEQRQLASVAPSMVQQ